MILLRKVKSPQSVAVLNGPACGAGKSCAGRRQGLARHCCACDMGFTVADALTRSSESRLRIKVPALSCILTKNKSLSGWRHQKTSLAIAASSEGLDT